VAACLFGSREEEKFLAQRHKDTKRWRVSTVLPQKPATLCLCARLFLPGGRALQSPETVGFLDSAPFLSPCVNHFFLWYSAFPALRHETCVNLYRLQESHPIRIIASLFFSLALASPALAQGGAIVPEPSDLTLFALGIAGVIIGRRASIKRRKDD
jgi:hypothetical protein